MTRVVDSEVQRPCSELRSAVDPVACSVAIEEDEQVGHLPRLERRQRLYRDAALRRAQPLPLHGKGQARLVQRRHPCCHNLHRHDDVGVAA